MMCIYVLGISILSFFTISIGFWSCSDSVLFFVFFILIQIPVLEHKSINFVLLGSQFLITRTHTLMNELNTTSFD